MHQRHTYFNPTLALWFLCNSTFFFGYLHRLIAFQKLSSCSSGRPSNPIFAVWFQQAKQVAAKHLQVAQTIAWVWFLMWKRKKNKKIVYLFYYYFYHIFYIFHKFLEFLQRKKWKEKRDEAGRESRQTSIFILKKLVNDYYIFILLYLTDFL